jgi:Insertion element 4 transposase N-terminal/Transposase DDE domain
MRLEQALEVLPGFVVPADLGRFRENLDPAWIEEALDATGTASVRRRRLPAQQVVWLVVGMALLRNESIERVVAMLGLALPSRRGDTTARSSITQARQRLGEEPLAYLFATTADRWADQSAADRRWHDLALYGMDGSNLRAPDSPENWAAFGGQCGNGKRNGSAYPMVRMLAVMALRSHLLSCVRFADYATGEVTLAGDVWNELPDNSLMIADRAFLVANDLTRLARSGKNKQWLTRAKSTTRLRPLKRLGRNDRLVEIQLSDQTRRKYPELPPVWQVRAIKYQRKGFRPSTLLTSLCDAERYPADEIVALYHERWEIELGYDEVKTHLLDRQEAIRSRTPAGVRQEIWGILLAYNLVRLEMARAAEEASVEPNRISFVNALSLIRNAWLIWSTQPLAPGRIPHGLLDLRRHLKLLVLPPRRSERTYPRAVKIKMSATALWKKSRGLLGKRGPGGGLSGTRWGDQVG